jgi:hypothetical protein
MKPEARPEPEVIEPSGRRRQLAELMSSEPLAAAYADAVRLRAHELSEALDRALGNWMHDARQQPAKRGDLELVRAHLRLYYDPSRQRPVFGPGGRLASPAAIGQAIAAPAPAPRAITAG